MSTEKTENWYGYLFSESDKQAVISIVRAAQYFKQAPGGSPQEVYAKYARKYAQEHGLQPANQGPVFTPPSTGVPIRLPGMVLTPAEARAYYLASIKAEDVKKILESAKNPTDPSVSSTGYRWNLPPHRWSLPYRPSEAYPYRANQKTDFDGVPDKLPTADLRALRRGRIRWRWANSGQQMMNSDGSVTNIGSGDDRKYGFQFMWNPEQFGTTVAVSYSTTPNPQDFAAAAPGYFPGVQSISLTIRLDRTNDFACFRGIKDVTEENLKSKQIDWDYWYPEKIPGEARAISYERRLSDLLQMGTMADVDYLLRTVNDPKIMKNSLGKVTTADAGFLSFNPVQFELGPIGYLGFIVGISVNHIGFTEDYIPIRTDVTITANMMTNVTSIAGAAAPAATPPTRVSRPD